MTKKLSDEERKRRKKERRDARTNILTFEKAQGSPPPGPPRPVNLCDDCAYEFGECEGVPKFGEEEGADNVFECPAFVNVASMPTADKPAALVEQSNDFKQVDEGGVIRESPFRDAAELVATEPVEGATEEEKAEDLATMTADIEARRRKLERFHQEEDLGPCQSCGQPLKRTAYNRERDAVRCVNGRCRQYRFIIKVISLGV